MIILGIESTCDETAASIVRDGKEILSSVVSSQIDLQKAYGGVVPELACRRHIDVIDKVIEEARAQANIEWADIDAIAVAHGPGLVGAILVGLNAAKSLALSLDIPLIPVNHIEAHLYAVLMSHKEAIPFPCLGAVVSGGHTSLIKMHSLGDYELIGQTVDDAVGEAFDKAARLLGLPYPGGPQIERLAKQGDPSRFSLKAGRVKGSPYNFSFSGLKTAILYQVKGQGANKHSVDILPKSEHANLAAAFQETALHDVVDKSLAAAAAHDCQAIILGGGVTFNQRFREIFEEKRGQLPVYWPGAGLSLDNAAMIAGLGYQNAQKQPEGCDLSVDAITRIPF